MRIKKKWIFLSLTLLLNSILYGQTPPNLKVKNYSLEDGLSHRLVTRIEKDTAGFLWLATPNGLNRFDGYNFLHFASGTSSEYPISGDYIGEIEPVEQGQFLVTYRNNLTNFDFLNPFSFKVTPIYFKELIGGNKSSTEHFCRKKRIGLYFMEKGKCVYNFFDFGKWNFS